MKWLCIALVRFYQKFISPLKPPCCRFTPSCSAYALQAFKKRGFFSGMILTVKRIARCNPFFPGGYDPVPDKGFKRIVFPVHENEDDEAENNNEESSPDEREKKG